MYKVRFNLGTGKNFLKWKITHPDGKVEYYEPYDVVLKMSDCFLRNQFGTAKKIFDGANKTVCAWVEAKDVRVLTQRQLEVGFEQVSYNPRVAPHWMCNGKNVDGESYESIVSIGRELFLQ